MCSSDTHIYKLWCEVGIYYVNSSDCKNTSFHTRVISENVGNLLIFEKNETATMFFLKTFSSWLMFLLHIETEKVCNGRHAKWFLRCFGNIITSNVFRHAIISKWQLFYNNGGPFLLNAAIEYHFVCMCVYVSGCTITRKSFATPQTLSCL